MTFLELQTKTRLLLGGISATEYSADNLKLALNNYYDNLIIEAILAHKGWEVNGEVATTSIVANQREYPFPADLLTIKSIEANLTENLDENQWRKLHVIDLRNISHALTNQQDADDVITGAHHVRLFDESLFFNWLPEFTVANGLKIYYSKEATALSADGDLPNLPQFLHIALAYGAAMDYAIETEQQQRIGNFKTFLDEKMTGLIEYYAQRAFVKRPKITTRNEDYR